MASQSITQLLAARNKEASVPSSPSLPVSSTPIAKNTSNHPPCILLVDAYDNSYIDFFKKFFPSNAKVQTVVIPLASRDSTTFSELETTAKKMKEIFNSDGVTLITTNNNLLAKLIQLNGIWVDNTKANPISSDAWQGAIFSTRFNDKIPTASINEVLFVPALKNLMSVPEAPFLFRRYLNKIFNRASFLPDIPFTWQLLDTETKCLHFYEQAVSAKLMAIDIETVKENHLITCCSYSILNQDNTITTGVIPIATNQSTMLDMLKWLKLLNKTEVPKILQNGRYDAIYFLRWNCPMVNWRYDTLGMNHALFSELDRSLGKLSSFYMINHKYWKDEGRAGSTMMLYEYNAKDTHRTLQIWLNQLHFISIHGDKFKYAIDNFATSFRLVFPALQWEAEGMKVNEARRQEVLARTVKEKEDLLAKFQSMVGKPMNPNSSKQVRQLLKALMCEQLIKQHGTDAQGLDAISFKSPLAALFIEYILDYRKLVKSIGTYLDLDGAISGKDSKLLYGRLHSSFNPWGTDTSRLAARESSFWTGIQMMNIPRDSNSVKYFIEADEGFEFTEPDMSQSEARGTAHLANCEKMIYACEHSPDFHSYQVCLFFGVQFDDIWDTEKKKSKNKKLRDLGKRVNHGSNYNMGDAVMLSTMGIRNVLEAQALLKLPSKYTPIQVTGFLLQTFNKTYPEVKVDWYGSLKQEIATTKKLTLPSIYEGMQGWTRYCFGDPTKSKPVLNSYVAHKPQALSVQTINGACWLVWATLQGPDFRMKAQIHDAILFQSRIGTTEYYSQKVKELMEIPIKMAEDRTLLVPVDVGSSGQFWGDLK